jgi:hypothetical protein
VLIEWLAEIKNNVNEHGIRWGLALSLYALFRKERRNFRLDKRDEAIFHNLRVIMEKLEVLDQWHGPVKISSWDQPNYKKLFSSLRKEAQQGNQLRRKKKMLKYLSSSISKKLIAFLVAAAVTALNSKLGLNLNADSIYGIIGLAIAYIAGQSHVDAKKAISSAVNSVSSAVIEASATTDGSPLTTIISPPMTFEQLQPYITDVHNVINKIFAQVSSGKYTDSTQNAINMYMTLHDYFTKNKEVDHAATESK